MGADSDTLTAPAANSSIEPSEEENLEDNLSHRFGGVIGRYRLGERVAIGGMGIVFAARDRDSNKKVALKLLKSGLANQELAERFRREIDLLAQLDHPSIVRYIDHGLVGDGFPYLVMEWLEGESLDKRLKRGRMSVADSCAVVRCTAQALAYAHGKDIVHRDVKPSNLLITNDCLETIKLLDFGVAHLVRSTRGLTLTGAMIGTPGYIAPEQVRGQKDLNARADIFSLGCVLYQCLTGSKPFTGVDAMAVLAKILLEHAPALELMRPDVPTSLSQLVVAMLAKDPWDRPANGAAVVAKLDQIVRARSHSIELETVPPPLLDSERRLLSIVLVGAPPSRQPRREPELERFNRAVETYGGKVMSLVDGAFLVALEGRTEADEPARAAHCALALQTLVRDAPIAVVSGRGTVSAERLSTTPPGVSASAGFGAGAPRSLVGEVIEAGFEVLAQTPAGAAHVDEVTAQMLGGRFELESSGATTHRLVRDEPLAMEARQLLGRPTSCVGRTRELALLMGTFEETSGEQVANAVVITGPAGIGKSRVRHELVRRLTASEQPVEVLLARGDALRAGVTLGMLRQLVRHACALGEGESEQVGRDKLRLRLRRYAPTMSRQIIDMVGELAGVPAPADSRAPTRATSRNAGTIRDAMCSAWVSWLRAECKETTVLVVIEDAHWADEATLQAVAAALEQLRDAPLMIVALGRPLLEQRFATLWFKSRVQKVELVPLRRAVCERLVRDVLGEELTDEMVELIVSRSGGNALYLEELIRAAARGETASLPDSVLGLVQARLDSLTESARRALRAASVFGETFWRGGVAAVRGTSAADAILRAALEELTEAELSARVPHGSIPGEVEYRFRHALVRDAAYAMLADADRCAAHRAAARWLESSGVADAVMIVQHCERASDRRRLVKWCTIGAEQALDATDLTTAERMAERGIRGGARDEVLGRLRLVLSQVRHWRGQSLESRELGLQAALSLQPGTGGWFSAMEATLRAPESRTDYAAVERYVELQNDCRRRSDTDTVEAMCVAATVLQLVDFSRHDEARKLLEDGGKTGSSTSPSPPAASWASSARAAWAHSVGRTEEALTHTCEAIEWLDKLGDRRRATRARIQQGSLLLQLGQYTDAEAVLGEALSEARLLDLGNLASAAASYLGLSALCQGDPSGCHDLNEAACRVADDIGDPRAQGLAQTVGALAQLASAEPRSALERAQAAAALLQGGQATLRAFASAIMARAELTMGNSSKALEHAREAFEELQRRGSLPSYDASIRLTWAECLYASGDVAAAEQQVTEAADRLRERAALISEARRENFLQAVPDHARTLALAEGRCQWGRPEPGSSDDG